MHVGVMTSFGPRDLSHGLTAVPGRLLPWSLALALVALALADPMALALRSDG